MEEQNGKIKRILDIYTRLINGGIVNKAIMADQYHVNQRSIQRDIDDIRSYLEIEAERQGAINTVVYDRERKGYRLEQIYRVKLTNAEVLAVCKILLDSRAFTKIEMGDMLKRLVGCCVPVDNQKYVRELIANEVFHYVEPRHGKVYIDKLWLVGQAVRDKRYIEVEYQRNKDKMIVKRKLKPVAIMFSEYYFYMTAFLDDADDSRQHFDKLDDAFPTIYRIDRIQSIRVLDERFYIPYSSRFEEGEFRKRIQFMQGGELRKIKLKCKEQSLEAVLDKLPTARILSEEEGVYTISAEVFGKGIDMWLKGQGNAVQEV